MEAFAIGDKVRVRDTLYCGTEFALVIGFVGDDGTVSDTPSDTLRLRGYTSERVYRRASDTVERF